MLWISGLRQFYYFVFVTSLIYTEFNQDSIQLLYKVCTIQAEAQHTVVKGEGVQYKLKDAEFPSAYTAQTLYRVSVPSTC